MSGIFDSLTPERILEAVEEETGQSFTGLTTPLPSYINRVYAVSYTHLTLPTILLV